MAGYDTVHTVRVSKPTKPTAQGKILNETIAYMSIVCVCYITFSETDHIDHIK
jgi:hypothetical protein